MELAEIITQAVANSSARLNLIARRWPDRPIQIELSWAPQMVKCDMVVRIIDRMPPFRPEL